MVVCGDEVVVANTHNDVATNGVVVVVDVASTDGVVVAVGVVATVVV